MSSSEYIRATLPLFQTIKTIVSSPTPCHKTKSPDRETLQITASSVVIVCWDKRTMSESPISPTHTTRSSSPDKSSQQGMFTETHFQNIVACQCFVKLFARLSNRRRKPFREPKDTETFKSHRLDTRPNGHPHVSSSVCRELSRDDGVARAIPKVIPNKVTGEMLRKPFTKATG